MADLSAIANAAADLRYKPQESAIQRRLQELTATTGANETALNNYGAKGSEAVGQIYNVLDSGLAQNRTQNMTALNEQVANTGKAYDDASQVQNTALNTSRGDMKKMMAQMGGGVGQSGDLFGAAQSGTEKTVADIMGRNAMSKVGTQGDLGAWASKHDAVLGQGQDIAKQMRANKLSDLQSELLRGLSNNRYEGLKGSNEQNANLADILNERGSFLTTEMARLAEEQWNRQMQEAQLAQQAAIAQAELDARSAALASERSTKSKDYSREDARQALLDQRYSDETAYTRSQDALTQKNWEAENGNKVLDKQAAAKSALAARYYEQMNNPDITVGDKGMLQLRNEMRDTGMYDAAGMNPKDDPVYNSLLGQTAYGAGVKGQGAYAMQEAMKRIGFKNSGLGASANYIRPKNNKPSIGEFLIAGNQNRRNEVLPPPGR